MLEYEYEPEMEDSYRADFLKSFKKTVEKGYFSFIIIDAVNNKASSWPPSLILAFRPSLSLLKLRQSCQ